MNISPPAPACAPLITVLGQAPARIPTGGKIRAGIQVLTAKAAAVPQARDIYAQGVAQGHAFDQIEQAITQALPHLKHPLVPRNVPWFTVRERDFPNPQTARQILQTYGEDRGDGLRLYRFPVVFPSDQWQVVMPHELAVWGTHEKRYWSEFAADGRTRMCMCYAPVPKEPSGKRALRLFGGRKKIPRADNGGRCDPESCAEYQARQCNLTGRFVFFIPGIRSISAFELHTDSFYAMDGARRTFETIGFMRGGRISGFLDRAGTPFYLTKHLKEVAHIDEQGRAVRVSQWIIELEAPMDVTALLREGDDVALLAQADVATQILAGEAPLEAVQAPATLVDECDRSPADPASVVETVTVPDDAQPPEHAAIVARAQAYGIDPARFELYARRRWGAGWMVNPHGRRRVWDELDRYGNDPVGYLDKVETELARTG